MVKDYHKDKPIAAGGLPFFSGKLFLGLVVILLLRRKIAL